MTRMASRAVRARCKAMFIIGEQSISPWGLCSSFPAAESRLGDGELVLVHQAQHLVGVGHLGDLAGRPLVFRSAGLDGDRFARLVVRGGDQRQ